MTDETEKSPLRNFFAELKRRRVIRVTVVYAVVGWLVIEVSSVVLPALNLPNWSVTLVVVLVALGFPIALILAWAFDIGPHGLHRTQPADVATRRTAGGRKAPPRNPDPADDHAASAESRRTIAVLPFVNMSGDPDNEYFSDGIAEEILNLLTKLPQLKVASRTSTFVFKGKEVNIPTVAEELGVSTILEGSVRRAGERVRITAQLIETDTDSHLWSETYDRELEDVFAIQDDIARSIVDALKVTLSPKERRSIQNVATANPRAYDYYLKGRKYFYAMSRRDLHHAIQMYEQAIELDPKYALAYAGLADTYSALYRYAEATAGHVAKADAASRRAIELDPDSAEAHAARGTALFISEDYPAAEKEFETAILMNPNLYESYFFYGCACISGGNYEKAARLFAQAGEVNPADYMARGFQALAYESMGRHEESQALRRQALELIETHLKLNPDDARALYLGATMQAALGEAERAREWAERAVQSGEREPLVLYNVACVFALLGETDRAIGLLERAVELGFGDHSWLEHDSDLSSLRDDPRFLHLLEKVG